MKSDPPVERVFYASANRNGFRRRFAAALLLTGSFERSESLQKDGDHGRKPCSTRQPMFANPHRVNRRGRFASAIAAARVNLHALPYWAFPADDRGLFDS
jgi:hypothetical protein